MTVLKSVEFAPQLRDATVPIKRKHPKQDTGEADNVHVSPAEVEAWLKIFNTEDDQDK
jgi:hypothetical protein